MTKLKTNDGTLVDTRYALAKHKGRYVNGRHEILYLDPSGWYYLINPATGSVEWYCDELARRWFANNGFWNVEKPAPRRGMVR